MHDEDGFLAAIRQTPSDDVARLVFADWLDEQDDPNCQFKAEYIRLELRMVNEFEADCSALAIQLRHLAVKLDGNWLAVISRPKIEGCVVLFNRECPPDWSRLTPTRDPNARNCEVCQKTVRYARTLHEIRDYASRGYCTAITPALAGLPGASVTHFPRPLAMIDLDRTPLIERPRISSSREERCPDRQVLGDVVNGASEELEREATPPEQSNTPKPARRKKGRTRHRNIQRANWEEEEIE